MRTKVFHKTDYADKKGLNIGQNRFLKTTLNLRPIGRLPSPLKQLDWSEKNAVKDSIWARRAFKMASNPVSPMNWEKNWGCCCDW